MNCPTPVKLSRLVSVPAMARSVLPPWTVMRSVPTTYVGELLPTMLQLDGCPGTISRVDGGPVEVSPPQAAGANAPRATTATTITRPEADMSILRSEVRGNSRHLGLRLLFHLLHQRG